MSIVSPEGLPLPVPPLPRNGNDSLVDAGIPTSTSSPVSIQVGDHDVLSGRGGAVNGHPGNAHFRQLCIMHKRQFDSGNSATKRHIAADIVDMIQSLDPPGRFLKQREFSGEEGHEASQTKTGASFRGGSKIEDMDWIELGREKSILKAMQVMRDYDRADRTDRYSSNKAGDGNRKRKASANGHCMYALTDQMKEQQELASTRGAGTIEADTRTLLYAEEGCDNGIIPTDSDVLNGRGGFVNAHAGNKYFRFLAMHRKEVFDAADQDRKKEIAADIVQLVHSQDPPGRFLRRAVAPSEPKTEDEALYSPPRGFHGPWEVLDPEEANRKAVQALRDLKREKKKRKDLLVPGDEYSVPVYPAVDIRTDGPDSGYSHALPPNLAKHGTTDEDRIDTQRTSQAASQSPSEFELDEPHVAV